METRTGLAFAPLVLALTLPGCAMSRDPAVPSPAAEPTGSCDAGSVQSWVGQALAGDEVERIRAAAGARTTRVIAPGSAVTMDYRPDRLNIEHDAAMKIVAIRCG